MTQHKNSKKQAVGYVRVSTAGQKENGISMELQKAAITTFAKEADYDLVEIFEDAASGRGEKSFHKRPGLKNALEIAKSHRADILVWDWDRLSRHKNIQKQIRPHLHPETTVICIKDATKLQEASRTATFEHTQKVAEKISRLTKEGMQKKKDSGAKFGNPDILTIVQPMGTKAWSKRAIEHYAKIAQILKSLPDQETISYREIADLLNSMGLRTLHDKPWTKERARNPVKAARELLESDSFDEHYKNATFGAF